jgi:tetratricopeptide (TPR) repeat protein/tRNA A-37 threonylcarbamoyl transferase component Bud32
MADPSKTNPDPEIESTLGAMPLPPLVDTPAGMPARKQLFGDLTATAPMPSLVPEPLPAGEARYVRVRLHATGGIGQVWLVRDEALGRDIALKELRPDRADDGQLEARFLMEARITGKLEHPAIVPIYELARRPEDNKPFYTMRFIKGRTLSAAVEEYHQHRRAGTASPLDLQKLLGAFVSVANALAFAHSRGIVHRDLKGANVVLGDYGEVMVLDWGMAKAGVGGQESAVSSQQSSAEQGSQAHGMQLQEVSASPLVTAPGQVIGTPAYMAPEQACGDISRINARTDIYGLGAMLFEILTGQPPHDGASTLEVLDLILTRPTPQTRDVLSTVPRALDAICARAMAKEPDARYATASALADDLGRWLAGEPVSAWREPVHVRVQRWVGRHRALVMSAVVAVLVASVILAAATVYLTDANEREHQARINEGNARELAEAKAKEARDQGEKARLSAELASKNAALAKANEKEARDQGEKARLSAELASKNAAQARKHLKHALAAVDKLLTRVSEDRERLAYEPHMEQVRRKLLEDALEVYQELLVDAPDDPEIRLQTGLAFVRVGTIQVQLGAFVPAKQAFDRGLAMLHELTEEFPNNLDYTQSLAENHLRAGSALAEQANWTDAETHLLDAQKMLVDLKGKKPGDPKVREVLSTCFNELGRLKTGTYDYKGAAVFADKAQALRRELAGQFPTNADYQAKLAECLVDLAGTASMLGQLEQAETHFREAVVIQRTLAARADPETPVYRLHLARTLTELGVLLQYSSRVNEAAKVHQEAFAILEKTVVDFPDYPVVRALLASTLLNLGDVARLQKNYDKAKEPLKQATETYEELVRKYPKGAAFQRGLGWCHYRVAVFFVETHQPGEALKHLTKTVEVFERLVHEHPKELTHRKDLAGFYLDLAGAYRDTRQFTVALTWYQKALTLTEPLARDHPDVPQFRVNLGRGLSNLGLMYVALGKINQAEAPYRQAVGVYGELVQEYPANVIYQQQQAQVQVWLGDLLLRRNKDFELVLEMSTRAAALVEKSLAAGAPAWLRPLLVQAHMNRVKALACLGRYREALAELDRFRRGARDNDLHLSVDPVRLVCLNLMTAHALSLARAGEHARATAQVRGLVEQTDLDDSLQMQLARIYAQAAGAAGRDKQMTAQERQQLARQYAEVAMKLLLQLWDNGWFQSDGAVQTFRDDVDLEPLRGLPEFKKFAMRLGKSKAG